MAHRDGAAWWNVPRSHRERSKCWPSFSECLVETRHQECVAGQACCLEILGLTLILIFVVYF